MSLCRYSIPSIRNTTGCNNTKEMARSSTLLGPQFNGESSAGLGSGGKAKASTRVLPSNLALFLSFWLFWPRVFTSAWYGKTFTSAHFQWAHVLTLSFCRLVLSLSGYQPCADTISHRNDFQRVSHSHTDTGSLGNLNAERCKFTMLQNGPTVEINIKVQ